MQAQAQISGQLTGQAGGQLADLRQQNGSNLSSQTSNLGSIRRPWHNDPDLYQARQYMREQILHVFHGPISSEWQQRLPNLVRRLEEALFKEAVSKEDYMNLNTLERRLQSLMKRLQHNNRNQNLSHHNPHVGTMIPTPGLQQSGHVNAMIPTPGTDISTVNGPGTSTVVPNTVGMGNVISNSNENASLLLATDNNSSKMVPTPGLSSNAFPISGDNMSSLPGPLNNVFQSQQSISTGTGSMMPAIGLARVQSQMIPTPGLNTPHSMPMSSACSVGLGHSNVDSLTAAQHQLQQKKQLQQQQQLHQQQQHLQQQQQRQQQPKT